MVSGFSRMGACNDFPTRFFKTRFLRAGQPRVCSIVPRADGVCRRRVAPVEAVDRDLSARRRGRLERRRAVRENDYYRVWPTIPIERPDSNEGRGARPRRIFRVQSPPRPAEAAVGSPRPRHCARLRITGCHPLALRCSGLHGDGDPGVKSTGGGWLSLSSNTARRIGLLVPRRRAHVAAAANAARVRTRARDESDRTVRTSCANMNDSLQAQV